MQTLVRFPTTKFKVFAAFLSQPIKCPCLSQIICLLLTIEITHWHRDNKQNEMSCGWTRVCTMRKLQSISCFSLLVPHRTFWHLSFHCCVSVLFFSLVDHRLVVTVKLYPTFCREHTHWIYLNAVANFNYFLLKHLFRFPSFLSPYARYKRHNASSLVMLFWFRYIFYSLCSL